MLTPTQQPKPTNNQNPELNSKRCGFVITYPHGWKAEETNLVEGGADPEGYLLCTDIFAPDYEGEALYGDKWMIQGLFISTSRMKLGTTVEGRVANSLADFVNNVSLNRSVHVQNKKSITYGPFSGIQYETNTTTPSTNFIFTHGNYLFVITWPTNYSEKYKENVKEIISSISFPVNRANKGSSDKTVAKILEEKLFSIFNKKDWLDCAYGFDNYVLSIQLCSAKIDDYTPRVEILIIGRPLGLVKTIQGKQKQYEESASQLKVASNIRDFSFTVDHNIKILSNPALLYVSNYSENNSSDQRYLFYYTKDAWFINGNNYFTISFNVEDAKTVQQREQLKTKYLNDFNKLLSTLN